MIAEEDMWTTWIDFQSFIYYDYALSLFDIRNATKRWSLNKNEFVQVLSNPLFSSAISWEVQKMPMSNITAEAYGMYEYMNIDKFHDEWDFLLKFTELQSKSNLKKGKLQTRSRTMSNFKQIFHTAHNISFFLNFTSNRLFDLLDATSSGFVNWWDFWFFYQCVYLFSKFDKFGKWKIPAWDAYQNYFEYSDFPRVSAELRKRARRFNLLNQDTYIDAFTALSVLRIDDLVAPYLRRTDTSTLYEVELKKVFAKANLKDLAEGVLNNCLRGLDNNNIPKYDWECAFLAGVNANLVYLEAASDYNTAKNSNITLTNTVFYNVDPTLLPKKS